MQFEASRRIDPKILTSKNDYWANVIADEVIAAFPNNEIYTVAAGISPSGIVHFGNFRDVMTSYAVLRALEGKGKKTRFIFSWDNFDRLRKVPAGVSEDFAQYIGMPLSKVPDPTGKHASYAASFQADFEVAMQALGIPLVYRNQTEMYESGAYTESVIFAMQHRKEIGEIMFSLMTEKAIEEKGLNKESFIENYYPISIYSRFSKKDSTVIESYDGEHTVTYLCKETNQKDTIDLTKDFVYKLGWKIDWPMRWRHEGVVFEPGGHDHASPGSSFDVSSLITQKMFGLKAPLFVEYKFVGIQGVDGKMSGSKGGAVSPGQLLEIYEPRLLRWLYLRKSPHQTFNLAFDSEIYRQYEEYDLDVEKMKKGEIDHVGTPALIWSLTTNEKPHTAPTSFRQAVAFGQIMQWDNSRVAKLFDMAGATYDQDALTIRLQKAKSWLETYNREEMIVVRTEHNTEYWTSMTDVQKANVKKLAEALLSGNLKEEEIEPLVYAIPKDDTLEQKENAARQRAFFKDVYNLVISKDTGPRLSTFIVALGMEKVGNLLKLTS